jgi:hypothetical protein
MRAAYDSRVRFILMDSFSTSDDTRAFLQAYHPDLVQVRGCVGVQSKGGGGGAGWGVTGIE